MVLTACGSNGASLATSVAADSDPVVAADDEEALLFEWDDTDEPYELYPDEAAFLSPVVSVDGDYLGFGGRGSFFRSTDGTEWREQETAGLPSPGGPTWVVDTGDQWVALIERADSPELHGAWSPDLRTWESTPILVAPQEYAETRAFAASADRVVVVRSFFTDIDGISTFTSTAAAGPWAGPHVEVEVPHLVSIVATSEGFVGLENGQVGAGAVIHGSTDGLEWKELARIDGFFTGLLHKDGVLVLTGETLPAEERIATLRRSTDGGSSWSDVTPDHGLNLGWATGYQGPSAFLATIEGQNATGEYVTTGWASANGVEWERVEGEIGTVGNRDIEIKAVGDDEALTLHYDWSDEANENMGYSWHRLPFATSK